MKNKNNIKKNIDSLFFLKEYLPKRNVFYVVFDMSNGHSTSHRYIWWFDTKKDAFNHIKEYKSKKYAAELSEPHRVKITGY
jgi:hypothetical protein